MSEKQFMPSSFDIKEVVQALHRGFFLYNGTAESISEHVAFIQHGGSWDALIDRLRLTDEAEERRRFEDRRLLMSMLSDTPASSAGRREHASNLNNRDYLAALYRSVLAREARDDEIEHWCAVLQQGMADRDLLSNLANGFEAGWLQAGGDGSASMEAIVEACGRLLHGRAYSAAEIDTTCSFYRRDGYTKLRVLVHNFSQAMARDAVDPSSRSVMPSTEATASPVYMLGANWTINPEMWHTPEHSRSARANSAIVERPAPSAPGRTRGKVSVITSMYNGSKYIEQFMRNMTLQTIFSDIELVIIDAASPDGEFHLLEPYLAKYSNIRYHREEDRIGIYAAWNLAIQRSTGDYITNMNLDDMRRSDSLELQRDMLDEWQFADIVYQDFLYSFDMHADFDVIEQNNIRCSLPPITRSNIIHFNSPHNGPMWRRSLHEEIGYFNEKYMSAGDCDFWIRCVIAGKTFLKSNEAHVGYYVNPNGLSTGPETRGIVEHQEISRELGRTLMGQQLVRPLAQFADEFSIQITPSLEKKDRYSILADRLLQIADEIN